LQKANADIEMDIPELRIREHGVTSQKKDLLESFYSTTFYDVPENNNPPVFLQARTVETVFHFIAAADLLDFEIVYRTPGRDLQGDVVEIYLNDSGEAISKAASRSKWSVHAFSVREGYIRKGPNRLVIRWPYSILADPPPTIVAARPAYNAVFPVLGEISSFMASVPAASVSKSRVSHLLNIKQ
jgi:hypothetical protein